MDIMNADVWATQRRIIKVVRADVVRFFSHACKEANAKQWSCSTSLSPGVSIGCRCITEKSEQRVSITRGTPVLHVLLSGQGVKRSAWIRASHFVAILILSQAFPCQADPPSLSSSNSRRRRHGKLPPSPSLLFSLSCPCLPPFLSFSALHYDALFLLLPQPKQINEIKDFLLTARRKDARSIKIKRSKEVVKFKVRCKKYLYTLCVFDTDKADKLKQSLPPGVVLLPYFFFFFKLCHCGELRNTQILVDSENKIKGMQTYTHICFH